MIAAQFRDWFDSLWHGRQLAFTEAAMTVIAAGAFKVFARPMPPDPEPSGADPTRDRPTLPTRRLRGGQYTHKERLTPAESQWFNFYRFWNGDASAT